MNEGGITMRRRRPFWTAAFFDMLHSLWRFVQRAESNAEQLRCSETEAAKGRKEALWYGNQKV